MTVVVCKSENVQKKVHHTTYQLTAKLPGRKKRKRGIRSPWEEDMIDDLVDIVTNDERFTRKLIFENTKKTANKAIYEDILVKLKRRLNDRDVQCTFSVDQVRTRFKKCVSLSKEAALTVKTATGIKRFKDTKGHGKWFMQLYPIVKSRDSCQAEQGIEPGFDPPATATDEHPIDHDLEEKENENHDPSQSSSRGAKR